MKHDFHWLIEEMGKISNIPCLPALAGDWKDFVKTGMFSLALDLIKIFVSLLKVTHLTCHNFLLLST